MESVVVIDLGSHSVKAGLALNFPSEQEPRVVCPTAVYITDEATRDPSPPSPSAPGGAAMPEESPQTALKGKGRLLHPVERGIMTNWDGILTLLYDVLYTQLGWEPGDEGSVLLAEPLFMSKPEREELTRLMFEELVVNGFFMVEQPVLSLYCVGKLSGCVVDIGHGKIDIATVVEGQAYQPSMRRLHYGGADLTAYLAQLLETRGIHVTDVTSLETVKEKCIKVVERESLLEEALEQATETQQFELPGGQSITIEKEGLLLGEALVKPAVFIPGMPSLASVVFSACMCYPDVGFRKGALEAILVCGGGSSTPGVAARLLSDIKDLCPPSITPALLQVPEYMPEQTLRQSVWMGGAVLSKGIFQQNQHITRADYDEIGPLIVHRKCC